MTCASEGRSCSTNESPRATTTAVSANRAPATIIAGVWSNVECLQELFARFNESGELDFTRVHPDVEIHSRPDVPDRRVWRGIEGVRAFFEVISESFDPIRWEPREFIVDGRHVVVRSHVVAYGSASGAPIEFDEAQLWTFRDGLIARLQAFATIEEAYATAKDLDRAA
jgi:ketosteroid isomerase-like protein